MMEKIVISNRIQVINSKLSKIIQVLKFIKLKSCHFNIYRRYIHFESHYGRVVAAPWSNIHVMWPFSVTKLICGFRDEGWY